MNVGGSLHVNQVAEHHSADHKTCLLVAQKTVFLNITSIREKLPAYHSISVLWWVTLRLLTGVGGI